jgi:endoplasmic reticulum-Golgi intermediate compartment protein 3
LSTDDGKDHHEHSEQKVHLQTFDEATENTIKKVKEALKNGEGCRV